MFEPNTDEKTKSRYPYLPNLTTDYIEVAYDAETLEPLCSIPAEARSWACQYMAGMVISRMSEEGVKKSEIRKQAEERARQFNRDHCAETTYVKTIKHAVKVGMQFQAVGQNTRAVPERVEELGGRQALVFRYPRGGKAKGW